MAQSMAQRVTLNLNGTWQLTYAEGRPRTLAQQFLADAVPGREFMTTDVPEPLHAALERAGLIEEPEVGMNTLSCRWVEECAWVYRRRFEFPKPVDGRRSYLRFACLDMDTTVYLNGDRVGSHQNAHRPACFDVTDSLRAGSNLIVVVVDSGRDRIANLPRDTTRNRLVEVTKSAWLRRPQYQAGWDWNPHLFSLGILGSVELVSSDMPLVDDVGVVAEVSEDLAEARVRVRLRLLGGPAEQDVQVSAFLREAGAKPVAEATATAREGAAASLGATAREGAAASLGATVGMDGGEIELLFTVDRPELWWPWELGEQHLYELELTLETAGDTERITRRFGARRVELRREDDGVGGSTFHVVVNGIPVFCKGANWVPPSLFPSAVADDRHRELVHLARQSNMNMLRVWGGGTWMPEAALAACDELGIMVWHDFLFACADYAGTNDEFLSEVKQEVRWGVRSVGMHPSLVVWCGNNEVEQTKPDRGEKGTDFHTLFLDTLPRIVSEEAPDTPYWPASPHSKRGVHPNNPHQGDQHPWFVTLGSFNSVQVDGVPEDYRLYRLHDDRFPNEGGVLGSSPVPTLRSFVNKDGWRLRSPVMDHHDNFVSIRTSPAGHGPGHSFEVIEYWLGRDPLSMSVEEHATASMLLHARGLEEYIRNFRRRKFLTGAAIYWMFNDSWLSTHGWPTFASDLRKKLAFHPVRRAFAPVSVVVAEDGDRVGVWGTNDLLEGWTGRLRYGLVSCGGSFEIDESLDVELPPNASTLIASFSRDRWTSVGEAAYVGFATLTRTTGATMAQATLMLPLLKEMAFEAPTIDATLSGEELVLTADRFAWGVCLDLDGERELADNCVDLLPGIPYRLPWPRHLGAPEILAVGSRDFAAPPTGAQAEASRRGSDADNE